MQCRGDALHQIEGLAQCGGQGRALRVAGGLLQARANLGEVLAVAVAAARAELAAEQVDAMDAFGALVDGVQAVVAVQLLQRILADVAGAAEHLHADLRRQQAVTRGV
ncbi:hypothetical protein D3C81_1595840 [compost metagenome]